MHPQKPKETFNSSATPQESLSARQHSSACPWSATNNLRESLCASTPAVCALTRGSAGKGGGAGLACTRSVIVGTLGGGGVLDSTRSSGIGRDQGNCVASSSSDRRGLVSGRVFSGSSGTRLRMGNLAEDSSSKAMPQRAHQQPLGARQQRHLLGLQQLQRSSVIGCASPGGFGWRRANRTRDDVEAARNGASSDLL